MTDYDKFTLWDIKRTIYMKKNKQYLCGLLFFRNPKETHAD